MEIAHIERIYPLIDLFSMRMTNLKLTFLCEFGRGAHKATYCAFNLNKHIRCDCTVVAG
jgi:hypothetical protein